METELFFSSSRISYEQEILELDHSGWNDSGKRDQKDDRGELRPDKEREEGIRRCMNQDAGLDARSVREEKKCIVTDA